MKWFSFEHNIYSFRQFIEYIYILKHAMTIIITKNLNKYTNPNSIIHLCLKSSDMMIIDDWFYMQY